jgi:hypothetical protein
MPPIGPLPAAPQVFTHKNGRSAGCATIEFKQHSEACQALLHMRTSTLHGKDIEIQWFNPHLAADPAYKAKAQGGEAHHGMAGSPRISAGYHSNPFNMAALQGQQVLFPHVYSTAAEAAAMVQQAAVQHAMQQEIMAAAAAAAAYQEAVQQAAMQHAGQHQGQHQGGSQQEQLLASMYAANAAAAAVVAQAAGHPDMPGASAGDGSDASMQMLMKGLPSIRTNMSGHMSPDLSRGGRQASPVAGAAGPAGRQGSPYPGFQQQPGSPKGSSPGGGWLRPPTCRLPRPATLGPGRTRLPPPGCRPGALQEPLPEGCRRQRRWRSS